RHRTSGARRPENEGCETNGDSDLRPATDRVMQREGEGMKTLEKINWLLDRLEGSASPEDTTLWVHRVAPHLSDVDIDATVALCNDILTGNKRLAIDIMFLEQL